MNLCPFLKNSITTLDKHIMKTILIIEDNTDIRENLEEILELDNYLVVSAPNGKIGIEKALVGNPDLIVCDIAMPIKNGYEVFAAIQLPPLTHKIPFIFLTASAQEREIAMGKISGADAYMTKPFQGDELLSTIKNILT